jgi:hypothetical protein
MFRSSTVIDMDRLRMWLIPVRKGSSIRWNSRAYFADVFERTDYNKMLEISFIVLYLFR